MGVAAANLYAMLSRTRLLGRKITGPVKMSGKNVEITARVQTVLRQMCRDI